jgi:hypothetical protein
MTDRPEINHVAAWLEGERAYAEGFWSRVQIGAPDECWLWPTPEYNGYGRVSLNGKKTGVHRVAYQLAVGSIPPGSDIEHTCHTNDNTCFKRWDCPHRACVNPAHLEPVTRQENLRRAHRLGTPVGQSGKTHCPSGHPYNKRNTQFRKNGHRVCATCNRERARRNARHG